jgi:hypothetical protein
MSPGFGQQPRFIVTIQPAGAIFNPPARITLPNVDGLAPRAVTEMYSFDHDIGSFVAIGTGTVSDDGLIISSNPGIGVLKAGWHCGGNPATSGTAACCPECQICQGNQCVTNTALNNQPCSDEGNPACTIDKCTNGTCNHETITAIAAFTPDPYGIDTAGLSAATQTALTCLQNAATAAGGSLTVTSAFRPQTYQNHIREVWDKFQKIRNWNEAECNTVKANIQAEWNLHGLAFQPAAVSNHTAGTAFDANWNLPAGVSIDTLAAGCSLSRCVPGDNVHFCR